MKWVLQVGLEARRLTMARCTDSPDECAARFDYPLTFLKGVDLVFTIVSITYRHTITRM
jgi:hypothetical protein